MKSFNINGPCKPDIHYMLPATIRLPNVRRLIDQQLYLVLHAPRQVGKTTSLMELARELTAEGRYTGLLVTMEAGSAFKKDPGAAELAILGTWRGDAVAHLPPELRPPAWPDAAAPGERIYSALQAWAQTSPRPLVLFLDEIDALEDETLISVLRQLRAGHRNRPQSFPWSLALVGLRDVRDYKVASGGSTRLHTASPFNIKRSLSMRNFTQEDVAALYQQHTAETGQVFTPEALQLAFEWTQGQPWLVNDLARESVEELAPDPATPITPAILEQARENLIARQDTHLDSLAEKLREQRVRHIIEPMLAGALLGDVPEDDRRYLIDLGLVRTINGSSLEIANPIYREVIPRALAGTAQASLPHIQPAWLNPDGSLDAKKLLESFLKFWRQHGQPLLATVHYHEIAPHLVMMAFLHRVVNGGGTLEREYAIGSGRMDLCLRYGSLTLAMELKVWRDGRQDPLKEGLSQLDDRLSGLGLDTGWLVIFDQRSGLPDISERTTTETATTPSGRNVTVIRG